MLLTLSATLFLLMESCASCGMVERPYLSNVGMTSTSSQSMGAWTDGGKGGRTRKGRKDALCERLEREGEGKQSERCERIDGRALARTFAAEKIFFTDAEISGPMPSPGIMVTRVFSGARTAAEALKARLPCTGWWRRKWGWGGEVRRGVRKGGEDKGGIRWVAVLRQRRERKGNAAGCVPLFQSPCSPFLSLCKGPCRRAPAQCARRKAHRVLLNPLLRSAGIEKRWSASK